MNDTSFEEEKSSGGINANDVLFLLFRRKWIVIVSTILGLGAAVAAYMVMPPTYESQAKVLVRFAADHSPIESVGGQANMSAESQLNSEIEIFTSKDIAAAVIKAVNSQVAAEKLEDSAFMAEAIRGLQLGLSVTPVRGSNTLLLTYRDGNPVMAKRVLEEILQRYPEMHREVHDPPGAFEVVTQQAMKVKAQLSKTESELNRLKASEEIVSLNETSLSLSDELAQCLKDLRSAEADLAQTQARVKEMENWSTENDMPAEPTVGPAPRNVVLQYQALITRLGKLRQMEFDALAKYASGSSIASRATAQVREAEEERLSLEKKYPSLAAGAAAVSAGGEPRPDIFSERTRLAAMEARVSVVKSQLEKLRGKMKRFSEISPQIAELERRKEIEETHYKSFETSLQKAMISVALEASNVKNISIIQKPSSAIRVSSKMKKKIVFGLAAAGLAIGVALAFLVEFFLDRSVKRPAEFETQLHVPMLSWIPLIGPGNRLLLQSRRGRSTAALALPENSVNSYAPWDPGHFIRKFTEEIRDRLILYFEIKGATHKPKLVAVTSCSERSGASTVAGGLATALSKTGEGKVLLVDMSESDATLHPFFEGSPIFSMADALDSQGTMCAAADNLYLATASLPLKEGESISPRAFYNMVPRFQSSDFDYIVFDMPPLNQSSGTLAIARFMDKILMVVESEKVSRDAVQRSYAALRSANPNVSAVLNKTKSYTPSWLGLDS